jgi:hypothetical protein
MASHFGLQEEFRYFFFGSAPVPSSEGITQSPTATRMPIFPYVCPLHIDDAGKALKGSYRQRPSWSKLPYIPDKCRPAVTEIEPSSPVRLRPRASATAQATEERRDGTFTAFARGWYATCPSRNVPESRKQGWSRTYNTKFPVRELGRKTTANLKKGPWR